MTADEYVEMRVSRGADVKKVSDGWLVTCPVPAHDDRNPSLHVSPGDDGRALIDCKGGCDSNDVVAADGITMADLFPDKGRRNGREEAKAYPYTDENGNLLFEVVRLVPKDFRQRRPDGKGGWVWNIKGVERVLYRLPRVKKAIALGEPVYVVEGEKDADALERAGVTATCNSGGAGKWRQEHTDALRGATVVIVADADKPGRDHACKVAAALEGVAASVRVVEPAKGSKDASDHLAEGHTLGDFISPPSSSGALTLVRASDCTPANVAWLWRKLIPLKALSLLAGVPGQGKSTLVCGLGSDVTRGRLPGDLDGTPRHVVIASMEDTISEVLVPRLIAADADLAMVSFVQCTAHGDVIDLGKHLADIEALTKSTGAALVVIDPMAAALGTKIDGHKDQSIRATLAPAAAMAERLGTSVLGVMHFSKSAVDALLGVNGSIGFVGAARSVLVFGPKPDDEEGNLSPHRILAHAKSNWGPKQRSRAATVEPFHVDGYGAERIETSRVVLGEEVDVDPNDLMPDHAPRGRPPKEREQVKRAVVALLREGPRTAPKITELVGRPPKDRTVRTALKDLVDDGVLGTAGDPPIYSLRDGGVYEA